MGLYLSKKGLGYTFLILAIFLQLSIANGIIIEVSPDTKFGTTNILVNPDFEEGNLGWNANTARPDLFAYEISNHAVSGEKSAYIRAFDGLMSGYWSQSVNLNPGEKYKYSFWGDIRKGYMLCYVSGSGLDRRKYLSSYYDDVHYPVFLKADHMENLALPGWNKYSFEFVNSKNVEKAAVHLGIYFSKGEAYYDNVYFGIDTVKFGIKVKSNNNSIARIEVMDDLGTKVFEKNYSDSGREREEWFNVPADASHLEIVAYDGDGSMSRLLYPAK